MKNNEALRCLLCKKPKCSLTGCPVHTPVPECMALYRQDRLDEAGKLLFDNNPLSAVTSRVCDWRKFCFGNCVLNVKKMAVRWYEIEQEVSDRYLFLYRLVRDEAPNGKKVAIVGAGPAGIVATIWLYRRGFDVTLFDANERIGGVLRYGIPPFRLDKKYVDVFERIFAGAGIDFRGGMALGRDLDIPTLSRDYDAVFLATGAEESIRLRIPGEERPNVINALAYLKNPTAFDLGKKVIVIGGGNVAMDACRTAVRSGVETWIYYRKTFENMPANPFEIEEAQRDGVRIKVFQAPVEVTDGGVVFRDCENVSDPETGALSTRILEGTDHLVTCDTLIPAISERPDLAPFGECQPSQEDRWPVADEQNRLSFSDPAINNVFCAGDFILGPKTVVEAVASARIAVEGIVSLLK